MSKNSNRTSIGVRRGGLGACIASLAITAGAWAQADDETVTLNVKDTELAQVLELLSINTQRNIVASPRVSGLVTANFYDVTFKEALDAILTVNGFSYEERGDFIYVYTEEEWLQLQAQRRKTVSATFELDYLAAADAAEFIAPLLSEDGQASSRGDVAAGYDTTTGNGGADSYAYSARIVINDYEENIADVRKLLNSLDTPPHQVLVESTIVQTTISEDNAFGIDFSVIGSLDFANLRNPLTAVGDLLAGSDGVPGTNAAGDAGFTPADNKAGGAVSSVGNTAGPGGLKVGVIAGDFAIFMKALDEVTDTTVLARPKIMCLNRQRASVLVGQRVGYLSTTATETASTQTVEYLDTGIQLKFRPFVSRDGMIRLELQPSVSEARLRNVTNQAGLSVTIPDEATNELTTNVRVKDNETLVLGGLYREQNTVTRRQVPILGDIPIVGEVFRGQEDTVRREEIIFLITPTVMDDVAAWEAGRDAQAYGNGIMVGSRDGLLPFGRSRMTEAHNRKAVDAYNRGDLDMAVFHTNNSLRLSPQQPEMQGFRERVLGVDRDAYERSLLYRIYRHKLEGDNPGS
ncbi:MAG: hypothetical protein AB8G96_05835 [Phycisphaerales bacterium]